MAKPLKDKKLGTLILIVLVGVIIGAFFSAFLEHLPIGNNVVVAFFTYAIKFGVGDPPQPLSIDLAAIKFQFGLQFKVSLLSILGVFLSLYFFRWYK